MVACVILFMLGALAFGVSWLSHHARFVIDEVRVEGTHEVPIQSIGEYVFSQIDDSAWRYISQKSIFFYNRGAIENGLVRDMPRIKSAKLSRPSALSQTLVVTIEERQPSALWCDKDTCYQTDNTGFVFAEASSTVPLPYTFSGGIVASSSPVGQFFVREHIASIFSLLQLLEESQSHARSVSVISAEDFMVHIEQGFDLKISFGDDAHTLVRNLQLVRTSDALKGKELDLEYIDLRFGSRVYYKMSAQGGSVSSGKGEAAFDVSQ